MSNIYEPIYLTPVYKNKVWSGNYIGKGIGESWIICNRENSSNEIENKNMFLNEFYKNNIDLFGQKFQKNNFPILIKFLSVSSKLSVQVHPNNEYAKEYKDSGKMEVWYIIDCDKDARIVYGLKNIDNKGHLLQTLQDNTIHHYLNVVKVNKGDIIPIYPGTIHTIMGNVFIYEIQQNSDLTFRLYDWNRTKKANRKLHFKESFDVINLNNKPLNILHNEFTSNLFRFKVHEIKTENIFKSHIESCSIITVISGSGYLVVNDKEYPLEKFNNVIIPVTINEFKIVGNIKIIEAWL